MENSKPNIYLPALLLLCVAIGVLLGGYLNFPRTITPKEKNNVYRTKLNRLIDFIENDYVDNVDTDSIVDLTVNNILGQLDPHSIYLAKSEQTEEAELMKGDFVGIGVNFYMHNDTVAVIKPVEGGPSERAGIRAGDRILYAANYKLFGRKLPSDSLFPQLKGTEGSKIELTIFRKSENKKFKVTVTRSVIPIKSVDVAIMINQTDGYIKINRFAESTYDEFKYALTSLKRQKMQTLILDLRDNGGGYMERAIQIADELLSDKNLIVFTKDKKGEIIKTFATKQGAFETGKIYVLMNENSASASEILAGAIQDNDRGLIVGRRSFGKGLVQREMTFDDGSAVRLTVARYYTPSGRSIQKHYDHDNQEYFGDFERRFENGELYSKDSIKIADTLKFKTKKGRIVYGGGGIVPDIFVPIKVQHSLQSTDYLMQSAIVGHFVFEVLDEDRNTFQGLSFDEFLKKMAADDSYVNKFRQYLLQNGVGLELRNKAEVKRYLTAEFARQLYNENKSFEIIVSEDEMIKKIEEQK